ncbi:MAG: M1 family metallopeptidase [Bacteroidetes bacterium]|nr:M1 family metallopeptidase [Bacteroidota bacterium]
MSFKNFLPLLSLLLAACNSQTKIEPAIFNADMQTFSNYESVHTKHLQWDAEIDFTNKKVKGIATWSFENTKQVKQICFDSYALQIKKITVQGKEVKYHETELKTNFGSGLSIPIELTDTIVSIEYETGENAIALQWLSPEQTAGKKMPYLFTQCESIHARSLMPCQDIPANRITYNAKVKVPSGMMAVMSARNPTEKNAEGRYSFEMEIPVPTYLIALAAGDILYKAIDERCGVYTEPSMLEKAATELSDIPNMMKAAEELGGPYRWGKYDVLIAPPSFPIGGMENPRLTFATPTIIAGDKSLVSLIAHEMAHSWSGNLVTNATWNDLWLNEGFTTYFERRIMEKISGVEYNDMLWELGYQDMQSDFDALGITHEDTRLRIELKGRHPEEGFSNIPYEKGAVFIRMLEEGVGRKKFDAYLSKYFQTNAFKPMTTEKCLAFMDEHLFDGDKTLNEKLKVHQWVFEPGLPDNCIHKLPVRFTQVDITRKQFEKDGLTQKMVVSNWTTHEWLQFLRKIQHPLSTEKMKSLDDAFHLTGIGNSEIADEWYKLAISSNYEAAFPEMEKFLASVGRKKFLEPLYAEMMKTPSGKKMAAKIFEQSKQNYHPQTAKKIGKMLQG